MTEATPIRTRFLAGSAWMIAWRWAQRSLGIVSVIILARLLVPEDFGLVAMASVVVGFVDMLSDIGVRSALIQRQTLDDEHLHTGWTLNLLQRLLVAALLLPAAELGAWYFEEPRVVAVVQVMALTVVIGGLSNIGTVCFLRELDFKRDFLFGLLQKLAGFLSTVVLAFVLRDYWALVYGTLASAIAGALLSYRMHPFRPRPSLRRFHDLWSFSKWMIVVHSVRYLRQKADRVAVGGELSPAAMGQYTVAFEVATLPTTEVAVPLARALFPNYSRIAHRSDLLRAAFLKALGAITLLVAPIGVGLACVSEAFVAVLLGENWAMVTPLVSWLALLGALAAINTLAPPLLMAQGQTRTLGWLEFLQVLIVVPLAFAAAVQGGAEWVAASRVLSILMILPIVYGLIMRQLQIPFAQLLGMLWRPLLSAALMALVLLTLVRLAGWSPWLRLPVQLMVGSGIYVLSLYLLCRLSGLRSTLEYELFGKLFDRFKRRAAR